MIRRRRDVAGTVQILLGLIVWLGGATAALAADPSATPGAGGDPRSAGEGPGFVGEPLVALGLVVAIGLATVAATLLYVRLTGRRR